VSEDFDAVVDIASLPSEPRGRVSRTRAQAAAVMLVSGADFHTIADILKFDDEDQARRAAEHALSDVHLDGWDKEHLRRVLGSRLENLYRLAYNRAADPRNPSRETATKNALAVVDRMAKLYGLDEPSQVVVHSATQQQINDWVARMAATHQADLPEEFDVVPGTAISSTAHVEDDASEAS
jgi:hypothetical protein